jgi:hypothetical protein
MPSGFHCFLLADCFIWHIFHGYKASKSSWRQAVIGWAQRVPSLFDLFPDLNMQHGNVHAACTCSCCMFTSTLQVHVYAVCPYPCWVSMSMLYVCPCYISMFTAHGHRRGHGHVRRKGHGHRDKDMD